MTRVFAIRAALAVAVPAVLILTLGHLKAGVIVAIFALTVIVWCGIRAAQADRERRRRYREMVWRRREREGWEQQLQERASKPETNRYGGLS